MGKGIAVIDRLNQRRRRAHSEIIDPEDATGSTPADRAVGVVLIQATGKGCEIDGANQHPIHVNLQRVIWLVEIHTYPMPIVVIHPRQDQFAAAIGHTRFLRPIE